MLCRNVSALGSQSSVSENALSSDADENIEQLQLLAETVDKRKAQNRIAQRKHSQFTPNPLSSTSGRASFYESSHRVLI